MLKLARCLLLLAASLSAEAKPIRVAVWDEQQPAQKQAYTNFLGNQIAQYLRNFPNLEVKSVTLNDPEQGLSAAVLDNCDVLIWWGHVRNNAISNAKAKELVRRIKEGRLSLIALHSAHWSEPFVEAMNLAIDAANANRSFGLRRKEAGELRAIAQSDAERHVIGMDGRVGILDVAQDRGRVAMNQVA